MNQEQLDEWRNKLDVFTEFMGGNAYEEVEARAWLKNQIAAPWWAMVYVILRGYTRLALAVLEAEEDKP